MTSRHTKTPVPYSAAQMFDLVADVDQYPVFLPWCVALRVIKKDIDDGQGTLTADMIVAYKVFREKFRSKVTLDRAHYAIDVCYQDGPFKNLENRWRFIDQPDGGSVIDFEIIFEFKNFILQAAAQTVFDKAFSRMSEAFVMRADEIYG
ncbi:MAG: type II toxin-antitoxin system RatA family toxin [Marinicaulis sp.]|nr:type II toxin-antitoxin system RatA family toxin [Marinicaulis sp.]